MNKIKEKNKTILSGAGLFLASILVTIEGYTENIDILLYMGIAFIFLSIFYVFLIIYDINKRNLKWWHPQPHKSGLLPMPYNNMIYSFIHSFPNAYNIINPGQVGNV